MAKNPDKDSSAYQKKQASFLQDLHQFHRDRGTPFNRLPRIGGRVVNLYLLYSEVTALGGWKKVTDDQQWEDIQHHFHIMQGCANSAQALKQIYIRYLDQYEKTNHFGQDSRHQEQEEETTPVRKRTLASAAIVPLTYNYQQHDIPDYLREHYGMVKAKDFTSPSAFSKLERSLLCGLPNEVDFAMNVCTLLSNEGRHVMKVDQCPRVLELLLAHCGIFSSRVDSLKDLHEMGWKSYTLRNFLRFWFETVSDRGARELILSKEWHLNKGHKTPDTSGSEDSHSDGTAPSSDSYMNNTSEEHLTEDVLNLGQDLGMFNVEGQRTVQFAMILRNLSFETDNMASLGRNSMVLRFLLLCIHCKYGTLKQLGLDTLGNICLRMQLDPIASPTTKLVFSTLARCITSEDRFEVIGGLDMLARLSQVEHNEEIISDHLPTEVYVDVVRLLTVQDIHMIVSTLEALYQLSEIGEIPATQIAMVTRCVETLVSLVTIEAQSYGPSSLIGIKVVEHIPAGAASVSTPGEQPAPSPGRSQPVHAHAGLRPGLTHVPTDPGPLTQHAVQQQNSSATPSTLRRRPTTAATQSQPDNETLACNWLQAFYEVTPDATVTKMALYADYLTTCARCGVKGVKSNDFSNCIRVSFPGAQVQVTEKPDGSSEIHYKGLKRRATPQPFPPQDSGSTAMPTARTGGSRSTASTSGALHGGSTWQPPSSPSSQPPPSPTYPTIQQALIGQLPGSQHSSVVPTPPPSPLPVQTVSQLGQTAQQQQNKSPDSNLIKSLLANKVNQNIQRGSQHTNIALAPVAASEQPGTAPAPAQGATPTQNAPRKASVPTRKAPAKAPSRSKSPRPKKAAATNKETKAEGAKETPSEELQDQLQTTSNQQLKPELAVAPVSETSIQKVENQYVRCLEQELEKQAQAENTPVPVPTQQPLIQPRPSGAVNGTVTSVATQAVQPQVQQVMQTAQTMVLGQQQIMQVPSGQQMLIPQQGMPVVMAPGGVIPPVVRVAQTAAELQQVLKGQPQVAFTPGSGQPAVKQFIVQVPASQAQMVTQQVTATATSQPVPIQPRPPDLPLGQVSQPPVQVAMQRPTDVPAASEPAGNQTSGDSSPLEGTSILEAAVKKAGLLGGIEGDCGTPTSQDDKMEWQSNADSEAPSLKEGVNILEQAIASAGIGCSSSEGSLIDENSVPSPSFMAGGLGVANSFPVQTDAANGRPRSDTTAEGTAAPPSSKAPDASQGAVLNGLGSPQSVESLASEDSQPLPAQTQTQTSKATSISDLKNQAGALAKEGVLNRIMVTQMLEDRIIREELLAVNGIVNHIGNGDCVSSGKAVDLLKDKMGSEKEIEKKTNGKTGCVNGLPDDAADSGIQENTKTTNSSVIPVGVCSSTTSASLEPRTSQGVNSVCTNNAGATVVTAPLASGMMGPVMNLQTSSSVATTLVASTPLPAQSAVVVSGVASTQSPLKAQLNQPPKVHIVSQPMPVGVVSMPAQVQAVGQSHGLIPVAGQAQRVIQMQGQQGMMMVQQPQGMVQVVSQGQGVMTMTGQPQAVVTMAGQPQAVVTMAGQPQAVVTMAGQPQAVVTMAGQPQAVVTMAGQPQTVVTMAGTQAQQFQVINIVPQPGQAKVLLPQQSQQAQVQPQLQAKPPQQQQLMVQSAQQQQQQQISPQPAKSPQPSPISRKRPSNSKSPTSEKPKRKRSSSRRKPASTDSQKGGDKKQPVLQLQCEWSGCKRCFESVKLISGHVLRDHQNSTGVNVCQWEGCDGLPRQHWSFMHHLQDRHLNETALRAAATQRQSNCSNSNSSSSTPTPASSPGPPVASAVPQYPPDAALQAIKRYASKPPYPEFTDGRPEGPVTKHIRFTSALILRNLARYSALGRSLIKQHEVHLAYIALSSMEASSAISSCLWELHRH